MTKIEDLFNYGVVRKGEKLVCYIEKFPEND